MNFSKSEILEALLSVSVEGNSKNIIDSNQVTNLQIIGDTVDISLKIDKPTFVAKKKLETDILTTLHDKLDPKLKIKVHIEVEAPVAPPSIRGEEIKGVKNIIAIASGKGGVGKSTVTANMAVTLSNMGFKVGILDADIYGPSIPLMFDVVNEKPFSVEVEGKVMMQPVRSYGVDILSIGFFAQGSQAVVWRGPMATKALRQMIREAHWGELDFLLIDLPPGTGDIHLSLVQEVPITGAVVVSTPQAVALADAKKGIAMFNMDVINVPVLGLVENMAYFTPRELPENKYYLFGKEGIKNLAADSKVPFLGELPLVQSVRESGDVGYPAALREQTIEGQAFRSMTQNMILELTKRNDTMPPSEAVRITTMAGCSTK